MLAFGESYLHAAVWCFLPSLWFVVLREFVAALSRPLSVMVITVAAVALNAALTYGLVHGAFGLPASGGRRGRLGHQPSSAGPCSPPWPGI